VRFRRSARLDTSQVSDRRGAAPLAIGGGGVIGLLFLLVQMFAGGGGGGSFGSLDNVTSNGVTSDLAEECRTGADANERDDCRIVGVVNSVQAFWQDRFPGYREATTTFFTGSVQTGCGGASSAVGPFYCPPDGGVYIDLGFYDELRSRFGAQGGPFAEAYVIAHEYGHHVENLLGVLGQASGGDTGPNSGAVKVELMADCLAGMWANGAVATGFIEELTPADIQDGLDAAAAVGDDRIQERVTGQVDPESWTHGSADQRQEAFEAGYANGDLNGCNTFDGS
jgi:predicted metalloprotease